MRFAALLMLMIPTMAAATYDDILDVAELYNSQKKKVLHLESEKHKVLGLLYKIEKENEKIAKDKSRLRNDELTLRGDLQRISRDIVKLESQLLAIARNLHGRWDLIQKMQEVPWLYVFLSAESPIELEQTEYLFSNLNRLEVELAANYSQKLANLKLQKIELNRLALAIVGVRRQLKKRDDELKQQHLRKQEVVGHLDRKIKNKKHSLMLTKNLGKRLVSQQEFADFALLFTSSFFDKKGDLPHPVAGKILHNFGMNQAVHSKFVELLHKGTFYKATMGTEVKAIAPGRVSIVEQIRGLGRVLIIDHGNNYYSVYGNLQKALRSTSEIVDTGEVIAHTGNSSYQYAEGLYFEIRHFAEPENPQDWLKTVNNIEDLATRPATKVGES